MQCKPLTYSVANDMLTEMYDRTSAKASQNTSVIIRDPPGFCHFDRNFRNSRNFRQSGNYRNCGRFRQSDNLRNYRNDVMKERPVLLWGNVYDQSRTWTF